MAQLDSGNGGAWQAAITGGICEGKSTALEILREAGYSCASADDAAKEIMAMPDIRRRTAELAGLPADFSNRDLRQRIIESDEVREKVNQLTHPLISKRLLGQNAQFNEIPLVYEAGIQDQFAEVWVIFCSDEEKNRRLKERYGDEPGADLQGVQLSRAEKIARSNFSLSSELPWEEFQGRLLSEAARMFSPGPYR